MPDNLMTSQLKSKLMNDDAFRDQFVSDAAKLYESLGAPMQLKDQKNLALKLKAGKVSKLESSDTEKTAIIITIF